VALLHKRSRKILITFIFSYIIVLVIPIAIGSIVYIKAGQVVEEEVSRSKKAMLKQACVNIDARLAEIQQMSIQLASNYRIQKFSAVMAPLKEDDRFEVSNIIRDFQPYRINNSFIRDFYIFYRNSDVVVSSNAMFTPELFYEYLYSYKGVSYENWYRDIRKEDYYFNSLRTADMLVDRQQKRMITLMQSVPVTQVDNPAGLMVVLIDEARIRSILDDVALGGYAYVIDSKNNIMVSAGSNSPETLPDSKLLSGQDGLLHQKIGGRNMVISYISSSISDWKYVAVIPLSIYMEKVNYIRNTTIWIVGICFVVGLIAAYLLAYRNYYPIRRVVDTVSSWMGDMPSKDKNEIDYIRESVLVAFKKNSQLEQTVNSMLEQNEKIDYMVNKNGIMVKSSLIANLIKGRVDDLDAINAWLSFYDVVFEHECFAVILFHIDDCTSFIQNDSEQEWNLLRFVIKSVAEELSNENLKGYAAEIEYDTIALLVNFNEQYKQSLVKEQMLQMSVRLKDFLREHFKVIITVGIGGVQYKASNIKLSYNQAKNAMDYKIVKGYSSVISYDEITDRDKEYYYPIGDELQLINFIKVGDIDSCRKLLERIFQENFDRRKLPIKLIKCLFFDIMSTAIKVLDATRVNYTDIFGADFDPVDRLTSCETLDQIHFEIIDIYRQICEYINEHKSSHNYELKELILRYINEHFTEEDLSQTVIADNLGITAPYLSKFFKQETGENMVDYINRLRVEKAKYLLANTGLPLVDIAQKVGYSSNKTLIRIFKQYEGITPGSFRNSITA